MAPTYSVLRSWPMGREVLVDPGITEEQVRELVSHLSIKVAIESEQPTRTQVHLLFWGDREKTDQVAVYSRNDGTDHESLEFRGELWTR